MHYHFFGHLLKKMLQTVVDCVLLLATYFIYKSKLKKRRVVPFFILI